MRRFCLPFGLTVMLISLLCSCGTDPKIAECKEKLTASDWSVSILGTPFITLRFDEDGTGIVYSAFNEMTGGTGAQVSIPFNYKITEVSEDGSEVTIKNTYTLNNENRSGTMEITFVPGGLKLLTNTMPEEYQNMVFTPVAKN